MQNKKMKTVPHTDIEMVITDLDGTLLSDTQQLSEKNLKELKYLRKQGVIIVIATGRSLFKVDAVLAENHPFDYVIFSSGAGIYDWPNKQLLKFEEFSHGVVPSLCKRLLELNQNFIVSKAIPNNNKFWYHQGAGPCHEFEQYITRHQHDSQPLLAENPPKHAGQMMCIISNDFKQFQRVEAALYQLRDDIKVIRATSPVNNNYIWLEVFPDTVSKGYAADWLCRKLAIPPQATMGIGNDYNDIDLLNFTGLSYTVKNAPEELKKDYLTIPFTNDENGFSAIIKQVWKGRQTTARTRLR